MEHLTVSKEPVRFKGSRTKFSIKHLIVSNSQQVIQNIFVWTDRRSLKYHWVEVERILQSRLKITAFLHLFEQIRCLLQLLGCLPAPSYPFLTQPLHFWILLMHQRPLPTWLRTSSITRISNCSQTTTYPVFVRQISDLLFPLKQTRIHLLSYYLANKRSLHVRS